GDGSATAHCSKSLRQRVRRDLLLAKGLVDFGTYSLRAVVRLSHRPAAHPASLDRSQTTAQQCALALAPEQDVSVVVAHTPRSSDWKIARLMQAARLMPICATRPPSPVARAPG